MKRLSLLLSLMASSAHGQIFADFSTTLGDFTVQLDEVNSPLATANFITLAEGSRPWIDSRTGALRANTPFYDGIIFHRVVDDFIIQAGSPNGLGNDGPGYNFPDEVTNGLSFDTPYLFAMANSGPNSNGSQFFVTENTPTFLNGIHTIFGSVTVGQSVIDTIHATPVNASSPVTDVVINSVTIRRVGSAAEAFDEFAQELPIVSALEVDISEDGRDLLLSQPSGSTVQGYRSTDLLTWTPFSNFLDFTQDPATTLTPALAATPPEREFFRASLVTLPPSATAPSTYQGRPLTITADFNTVVASLDLANSQNLGTITVNGDPFSITEIREESTNGNGASLLVFAGSFAVRFNLGADQIDGGRMTGTFFGSFSGSVSGTYSLTTP